MTWVRIPGLENYFGWKNTATYLKYTRLQAMKHRIGPMGKLDCRYSEKEFSAEKRKVLNLLTNSGVSSPLSLRTQFIGLAWNTVLLEAHVVESSVPGTDIWTIIILVLYSLLTEYPREERRHNLTHEVFSHMLIHMNMVKTRNKKGSGWCSCLPRKVIT